MSEAIIAEDEHGYSVVIEGVAVAVDLTNAGAWRPADRIAGAPVHRSEYEEIDTAGA
jgi:hypothetical protein